MIRFFCVFLLVIATTSAGKSQPTICEAPFDMTPFCNEACIICDIDGFQGRHDSEIRGEAPPDFCVFGVENAQWIAFLAGSETLVVDVAVSNCDNFFFVSGLQMAVYESLDCENYTLKSNCIGGFFQVRDGLTGRLFMNDLVVGQYYYLVMDGSAGDNCDWSMSVQAGTTAVAPLDSTGVILVRDDYCIGDTISFDIDPELGATEFAWQLNGDTVALTQQWDTVLQLGVYEVCVVGSNACNVGPLVCDTITVNLPISDTIIVEICESSCITVGDSVLCQPGSYDLVIPSRGVGCDTLRRAIVSSVPDIQLAIDTALCLGTCINLFDTIICDLGLFQLNRPGVDGSCDTSIIIQVQESSNIVIQIASEVCENTCLEVSDTLLCEEGFWQFDRMSTVGCDTTYSVTLELLDTVLQLVDTFICPGSLFEIDGIELAPPAVYTQIREGSNTCDSTIRWTIEALPGDTIMESFILCLGDTIDIDGTVVSEAGLYLTSRPAVPCSMVVLSQVDVLALDTTSVTETLCLNDTFRIGTRLFDMAGTYLVPLVSVSGCDSLVDLTLVEESPRIFQQPTMYVCDGDSLEIGGIMITQSLVDTVTIQRVDACDSLVIVDIDFVDCDIILDRSIKSVGCDGQADGEIDLAWTGGLPMYTVQLILSGTIVREEVALDSTAWIFDNLPSGEYEIRVTDQLGNMAVLGATISMPVPLTVEIETSEYQGFEVSCLGETDGSIVVIPLTSNGPIEVSFSTGGIGPTVSNLGAGTYEINIVDSAGCVIDTSIVLLSPNPPETSLFVAELPCSTDTAALVVASVSSQLPIVSATYNGQETTILDTWTVLQDSQGLQRFSVMDINGCVGSDSVIVDVPSPLLLEIADTIFINQGDSILVLMDWVDDISTAEWTGGGLSCTTCLAPTMALPGISIVTVDVLDESGCSLTYVLTVIVEEVPLIILPNIFSPNGDNINDVWIVSHPSIDQVLKISIYDRWGNQVFNEVATGLGDSVGWDGRYQGADVMAGVYVFQVEYITANTGQVAVLSGTLTLVR